MIIKNGLVFNKNGKFNKADVSTNGAFIEKVSPIAGELPDREYDTISSDNSSHNNSLDEELIIDATGMYVIPGLTDIHFHGCMGHDFCDGTPEALCAITEYELSQGITTICPTSMTYDEEKLTTIFKNVYEYIKSCQNKNMHDVCSISDISAYNPSDINNSVANIIHCSSFYQHTINSGAEIVGINMEGPFLSYEKRGAQNPKYLCNPDIEMFNRLQKVSGNMIKLVDIAPELDGAMEFIRLLSGDRSNTDCSILICSDIHHSDINHSNINHSNTDCSGPNYGGSNCNNNLEKKASMPGIHISIAHTAADYDTAMKAFENGADHVTHLFNGMNSFHHRQPGVLGAASDYENCYVELIGDGIHSDASVVRMTLKIFGEDRLVLISDSMEACGMPDGEYKLGGQKVIVKDGHALLEDGTIAGSSTNLMECVRKLVKDMNIPLGTAVKFASVNPAKSIGIYDRFGSIDTGKIADIVILDHDLRIVHIIKNGKLVK